jgi:UPF0755 protein
MALALGCFIFGFTIYRFINHPMVVSSSEPVIIRIDKSMSAGSFATLLKRQQLISSERMLLVFIRIQGLSQQLKAGIYKVTPGESTLHFLYRVIAGDVLVGTFHIIEGTTQAQVSSNLEHASYLTYHANDWLSIAGRFPNAEGLLLADTYQYDAGSDSLQILQQAHTHLEQFLEWSWQHRIPGLPYTNSYQMLVAASILEKEASIPAEKRLISGIIVNRLRKHMPLQMDPTVIYALGTQYSGKLTREDLMIDSPYNTYRTRGLPPTPIAMVGREAIEAAAHPTLSNYLYFVARGDGSHYFSVNYSEQQQAVYRFLKK